METFTIKETKEAVDFLFDISDAVVDSLDGDGKITIKDAPKFFKPLRSGLGGLSGIEMVPKEMVDLSADELAELTDHIASRFDINDDALESKVEELIKLSGLLAIAIKDIYTMRKKSD